MTFREFLSAFGIGSPPRGNPDIAARALDDELRIELAQERVELLAEFERVRENWRAEQVAAQQQAASAQAIAAPVIAMDPWTSPSAQEVLCPECQSPEHMVVRPAQRARIVAGELVERTFGACVVCLVCDTPYVTAPHRAGGVIKRRRIAAGVAVPPPQAGPRRPDANGAMDLLARDLGMTGIREEP